MTQARQLLLRRALAASAAIALALAFWLSSAPPATGDSSPAFKPVFVICLTKSDPPRGKRLFKPRRCALHQRGAFPVAGANTKSLLRLRWKRWTARRAVARGKSFVSTVGKVKVRIVLHRPRMRCGEWVFTRARITEWIPQPGGTEVLSITGMRPDICLPLRRRGSR